MKLIIKTCIVMLFVLTLVDCSSSIKPKEYYCDNDDILDGTTCISKNVTPATPHYTCPLPYEYLKGKWCCSSYTGYCYDLPRVSSYSCSVGYLSGTNCILEVKYPAYVR